MEPVPIWPTRFAGEVDRFVRPAAGVVPAPAEALSPLIFGMFAVDRQPTAAMS